MSKAFTREDADASFEAPARSSRLSEGRLTAYGARVLRDRLAELEHTDLAADRIRALLDSADVVAPAGGELVALGAQVRVRSERSPERVVVLVTPDEVGHVPLAISVASPLGQALVGAKVGDTVELERPAGTEELTILALDWPL